jgi:hypothetical protein
MSEKEERALVVHEAQALPVASESWGGAAARGLQARQEREAIISSVLKDGPDFGKIPGTDKPTLLKPGAEKIADCLNLYPDYEAITRIEDWERPLFSYAYRCRLMSRGTDSIIATGIGSCNSMEARYRWRNAGRKCPKCGKETIIKGKEEFGGGWLCFAKKGGCGAKFSDKAPEIVGQEVGKVLNDDVFSLVNTVDKMAQKRALVAAALNLGFSDQFTQDMEDFRGHAEVVAEVVEEERPPHSADQEAPSRAPAPNQSLPTAGHRITVEKVMFKDGTGKNGLWEKVGVKAVGGDWYSTFDKKIGAMCVGLEGKDCYVEFTVDKKGYNVLKSIEVA